MPQLELLALAAYTGLALYLILLWRKPARLQKFSALDLLFQMGWSGHLRALCVRAPHMATLMILNYVALLAFGVQVPLREAIAGLPAVLLVACLPISIQGIGPTQGAMVFFFSAYAEGDLATREATVFAASLGTQAICILTQVLIGLVCVRHPLAQALQQKSPRNPAR